MYLFLPGVQRHIMPQFDDFATSAAVEDLAERRSYRVNVTVAPALTCRKAAASPSTRATMSTGLAARGCSLVLAGVGPKKMQI